MTLTSPIKGRDNLLLAKDLLQLMKKKQERWIRPLKEKDEALIVQKLGQVDWDIPGHRQILDISQARDIVEWSQGLGLIDINKKNMWTSLGAVLSKIIEQSQRDAFLCKIAVPNPLRLTLKQKVFFMYLLLLKEGDFLIRFVRDFPQKMFSANDVVKSYYDVWNDLAKFLSSSKEYKYVSKGRELSGFINHLKEDSAYLRVISKLENLTDLGILSRADERNYKYNPSLDKLEVLNRLSSNVLSNNPESTEDHWKSFFESDFFSLASEIFEVSGLGKASKSLTTSYVLNAYHRLVGGLGLCRIDEVSLLAGIEGLVHDHPLLIEQRDVRETIYAMSKQYGKLVSLHVDMLGNISYVKIDKSILSKVK
jgi:hypothetical protein